MQQSFPMVSRSRRLIDNVGEISGPARAILLERMARVETHEQQQANPTGLRHPPREDGES